MFAPSQNVCDVCFEKLQEYKDTSVPTRNAASDALCKNEYKKIIQRTNMFWNVCFIRSDI
ncbi:leucine-rich repeat-containing protein [Acrasis kona]|uniref:Leucine-rich repeat-containing protein n=1 Tax=Acrasis kona TaxID=1008807 RepID=A0AAW2ZGS6_9EUKA